VRFTLDDALFYQELPPLKIAVTREQGVIQVK
jgi:hypothetical protein